jgi:glycosyltransferase involved in cell wall biosynthesis
MKICFFKPNSLVDGGGGEKWIINVAKELSNYHKITIITFNYFQTKRLSYKDLITLFRDKGIKYLELPSFRIPRGFPLPIPSALRMLQNEFNSCDVVYVVLPASPNEILFYFIRSRFKTKFIAGFHEFLSYDILLHKLYYPTFVRSLKAFDAYHVLNRFVFSWIQKRMPNKNIFFIPNGIDTTKFQLCNNPSESRFFNILFTGRLVQSKGADILLKIIHYFNNNLRFRDVTFTITGTGPLEREVKKLASMHNNVIYLGFLPEQDLPEIYRKAHLFLIPSRSEGLPLRLLEAQACGLPVIGSRIPGISDVVINLKTGRLVEPGDVKSFAEAIKDYYLLWSQDPAQYYEMNKAIRNYIVKHYDWSIIIRQLELMFESIVNQ